MKLPIVLTVTNAHPFDAGWQACHLGLTLDCLNRLPLQYRADFEAGFNMRLAAADPKDVMDIKGHGGWHLAFLGMSTRQETAPYVRACVGLHVPSHIPTAINRLLELLNQQIEDIDGSGDEIGAKQLRQNVREAAAILPVWMLDPPWNTEIDYASVAHRLEDNQAKPSSPIDTRVFTGRPRAWIPAPVEPPWGVESDYVTAEQRLGEGQTQPSPLQAPPKSLPAELLAQLPQLLRDCRDELGKAVKDICPRCGGRGSETVTHGEAADFEYERPCGCYNGTVTRPGNPELVARLSQVLDAMEAPAPPVPTADEERQRRHIQAFLGMLGERGADDKDGSFKP